jgi:hypothetical protein
MVPLNVPVWFAIAPILGPSVSVCTAGLRWDSSGISSTAAAAFGPVAMEGGEPDKKYAERPPIDLLRPYDADKMTA